MPAKNLLSLTEGGRKNLISNAFKHLTLKDQFNGYVTWLRLRSAMSVGRGLLLTGRSYISNNVTVR